MTCQPVPSLSAKGTITGCSVSGSAIGRICAVRLAWQAFAPTLFRRPHEMSKPPAPEQSLPLAHYAYVKVRIRDVGECHPGKRPPATGCTRFIVRKSPKRSRIRPAESPSSTWHKPGPGSPSTSTKIAHRKRYRPQPLEGFTKSHSSRSRTGKSEPTDRLERTNLPVGRIGPP